MKETCLLLLGLLMDICEIFKKLFNVLNLFHLQNKVHLAWPSQVNFKYNEMLLSS